MNRLRYRCYYEKEFPVDEFGRPGGFYSLADLPVARNDVISRRGIIEAKNEESQKYRITDYEKGWEFWVPMNEVYIGEIHEDDVEWIDWDHD